MTASRRIFLSNALKAGSLLTLAGHISPTYSATSFSGDQGMKGSSYTNMAHAEFENLPHTSTTNHSYQLLNVSCINNMKNLSIEDLVDGQQIYVCGYHEGSFLGGGLFYWDASSSEVEDSGTIFNAPRGKFRRIYSTPLDICAFGALPGGNRSDVANLNSRALHAALKKTKSVKIINHGGRYESVDCSLDGDSFRGCNIVGEGLPEWSGSISLQTHGVSIEGLIFDGTWQKINSNNHLLRLREGSDYTIRGCHFKNLVIGTNEFNGSDGIYIRAIDKSPGYHVSNILIDNCKFYDIARQAVTVIQGENIIIQNCYSSTRRAFVDVEPNGENELARSVHVRDSYVDGERLGAMYKDEDGNDLDNINCQGYGIEFHNSSGPNPPNHNHHCSAENIYLIGNREIGGKISPGLKARRTMCSFKNIYCKYLTGQTIFEFSGESLTVNPISIHIDRLFVTDSGSQGDQILESYNNDVTLVLENSVFTNIHGYLRGAGLHKIENCYFHNCGYNEDTFILGYTTNAAPRQVLTFSGNTISYDSSYTPPQYFIREPSLNITRPNSLLYIERNHVNNMSQHPFQLIGARNVARCCFFSHNKLVNVDGIIAFRVDTDENNQLVISENDVVLRDGASISQGFTLTSASSVKILNNHFTGGLGKGVPFLALFSGNDFTVSGNTFNATSRVNPYVRVLPDIGSALIFGNTFLNPTGFGSTSIISVDDRHSIVQSGLNIDRT